jgi:hypothetical protein
MPIDHRGVSSVPTPASLLIFVVAGMNFEIYVVLMSEHEPQRLDRLQILQLWAQENTEVIKPVAYKWQKSQLQLATAAREMDGQSNTIGSGGDCGKMVTHAAFKGDSHFSVLSKYFHMET